MYILYSNVSYQRCECGPQTVAPPQGSIGGLIATTVQSLVTDYLDNNYDTTHISLILFRLS